MNPAITKDRDVATLEQSLGYTFSSPELLQRALTHSSQAR